MKILKKLRTRVMLSGIFLLQYVDVKNHIDIQKKASVIASQN